MSTTEPTMLTGDPSIDNYTGGRHLDAITYNPNILGSQRAVMYAIASQMHVKGDYSEERWIFLSTLEERAGVSESTVKRAVRELVKAGYLVKRFQKKQGDRRACWYRITRKLFYEFEQLNNIKLMRRYTCDTYLETHANVHRLRGSE